MLYSPLLEKKRKAKISCGGDDGFWQLFHSAQCTYRCAVKKEEAPQCLLSVPCLFLTWGWTRCHGRGQGLPPQFPKIRGKLMALGTAFLCCMNG